MYTEYVNTTFLHFLPVFLISERIKKEFVTVSLVTIAGAIE
jgi:hypothetical protein